MKKLSLEKIMNDSLWVVRHSTGYRFCGVYDTCQVHMENCEDSDYDYVKDFDLVCYEQQPEELQQFHKEYFEYGCEHGFITIQDYYDNVYNQKKVWTKDEIKDHMKNEDAWLYRGILAIYNRQTDNEQFSGETHDSNGVGFNGVDAPIMSSFAEFLKKTGFLTEKQQVIARKKMMKYAGQLASIANA